ncbi:MAG: metallopeptidase TldD-related protein [Kofleriaceae bacterium]
MSWDRREFLAALGVGSASSLMFAFGCRAPAPPRAPAQRVANVRTWLRDAVAKLAAVSTYTAVHALAVTRTRTTAAIDVLGIGVARARRDGVVLTVRDAKGVWREHVTADLSQRGIATAVRVLGGARTAKPLDLPMPPPPLELRDIDEQELKNRVGATQRGDLLATSSRIVYAASLVDIDDVDVWSVSPAHDRQYRTRRIRNRATRAAWAGTRPQIDEIESGWIGNLGDKAELTDADVTSATQKALQQLTPGLPAEGEANVVLEPGVVATVIDVAVRGLLTSAAARRPEVAKRLGSGATLSPLLSLVDDPLVPDAYGSFAFDDEGALATRVSLLDAGKVVGRLSHGVRPGHVGSLEVTPSNLVLQPGTMTRSKLLSDGWLLEGRVSVAYDPASDRMVLTVARAREIKNGSDTGRVFASVELAGELATLLARVDAVAADSRTTIVREEIGGEPRWRTITAPWLRTHGFVRAGVDRTGLA